MKKIFRYTYVVLAGLLALAMGGCTSEYDYDPASIAGNQVYFSNELESTIEVSTEENSFTVPVSRIKTDETISVPVTVTMSDGSIYTVQSQTVTFAAGQSTANVTFSYDPADIVYGDYADITIQLGDETYTTPYGKSSYAFKAGRTAWKKMGEKALYREDLVAGVYDIGTQIYEVEIYENVVEPGKYRIVAPYSPDTDFRYSMLWDNDTQIEEYYQPADGAQVDLIIDATDPDMVWFESFSLGMDLGYGEITFSSYVSYFLDHGILSLEEIKNDHPDWFGTLKDGIITMPTKKVIELEGGDPYTDVNANGLFAVALPGYKFSDYSLDYAYEGRFTSVTDNDFARSIFTLGEDLTSVKYTIIPGSEDPDEAIEAIIAGTAESHEVTATGQDEFPMDVETGNYWVVVVGYDGNEPVMSDVFEIKFRSSKDNAEKFNEIGVGIYTNGYENLNGDDEEGVQYDHLYEGDVEATLYQSESDPTRFKIVPWGGVNSDGLFFTLNSDNTITVDGSDTGDSFFEYGHVFACDFYTAGYEKAPVGYYDAENDIFHFYLVWYVTAGELSYSHDIFQLASGASAKARLSKARKASVKNTKNIHLNRRVKKHTHNTTTMGIYK